MTKPATAPATDHDEIDDRLAFWIAQIPALDLDTEGIVERIEILANAFERSLDATLAETGLDRRGYKVLMKLRRVGPPWRRSAGELAAHLRLSSGTMTHRIDRMEAAGLVRRLPDPDDRRGTLIEPTEAGHAIWERAIGTQAAREAAIASVLGPKDRAELHRLLRALMRAFPDAEHHPQPHDGDET